MLGGDLSNEPAPKVGIRFEDIIRRTSDGKLNRTGKAFIERLGSRDFETVLFTTGSDRKAQAFCYKWGVSYSKIRAVDSILELEQVCREQNLVHYYDTDEELLNRIKSRAYTKTGFTLWTLRDNLFLE